VSIRSHEDYSVYYYQDDGKYQARDIYSISNSTEQSHWYQWSRRFSSHEKSLSGNFKLASVGTQRKIRKYEAGTTPRAVGSISYSAVESFQTSNDPVFLLSHTIS
jgi:hypothetical protein